MRSHALLVFLTFGGSAEWSAEAISTPSGTAVSREILHTEPERLLRREQNREATISAAGSVNKGPNNVHDMTSKRSAAAIGAKAMNPEDIVQVLAGTDTEFKPDVEPFFRDFIGNGNALPQIKMPWGFNDWAPQTSGDKQGDTYGGIRGAFWFNRNEKTFQGMRCTHQPSPWLGDYGNLILQPHTDDLPRDLEYSSEHSVFRPYLFNSTLEDIGFEFVPTSHAALARMTFPKSAKGAHLSLRLGSSRDPAEISVNSGDIVKGRVAVVRGGVPEKLGWHMYFTLKTVIGALSGDKSTVVSNASYEKGQRATLHFEPAKGPVVVAVATSFISQEQADLNLEQEVGSKSFDQVLSDGRAEWAHQLSRVQVEAIDETQLQVFYTNLWKSMLFPRYLQEVNTNGQEVHRSPYTGLVKNGKLAADSGFWDSYISVYPLQSLVFPDNLGGLIGAWVDAYEEASWLPEWPSPGQENMMVGTLGDVSLADAIVKSKWGFLEGFDVDKAYEAIRKDAFTVSSNKAFGRAGLADYIEKGYVTDTISESTSRTLDYYIADAAIARAAGVLGKHSDEKVLAARSKRYSIVFNNRTHFFQAKEPSGEFLQPEKLGTESGFTEATAWQYRFFLPHDVEGLEKLYQGNLCKNIENMMVDKEIPNVGSYHSYIHEMREAEAISPEFGQYAHGNQPVHHVLYVAKRAGCNNVADKYLRMVMKDLYTTQGWAGDEDNGEMSSWYVLSALGVYALQGAKDEIVLGTPAVKHAKLQLPNNKVLKITTQNQAADNFYVQRVTWTRDYERPCTIDNNVIQFTQLMRGGTLHFEMGAKAKPIKTKVEKISFLTNFKLKPCVSHAI